MAAARPETGRGARSQNFLVDRHAVDLMVKAAAPEGLVLEPGAGEGVLTLALAEAGAKVVGYEIDPLLAGKLSARTRSDPRIDVVRATSRLRGRRASRSRSWATSRTR